MIESPCSFCEEFDDRLKSVCPECLLTYERISDRNEELLDALEKMENERDALKAEIEQVILQVRSGALGRDETINALKDILEKREQ